VDVAQASPPFITTALSTSALTVSGMALAFTILSFWWLHARRGKLIIAPPRAFAVANKADGLLLVQLPLVFYNDGPASQIVHNLRLTVVQGKHQSPILYFNNTVPDLAIGGDRQWARQFIIEGRKAHAVVCAFQNDARDFVFQDKDCYAKLEARLNQDRKWRTVLTFSLQVPHELVPQMNGGRLLPYDNDPDRWVQRGNWLVRLIRRLRG
jgi:hypothetical protein